MKDNAALYAVRVNTHYSFTLKKQTKVQNATLKSKQWLGFFYKDIFFSKEYYVY